MVHDADHNVVAPLVGCAVIDRAVIGRAAIGRAVIRRAVVGCMVIGCTVIGCTVIGRWVIGSRLSFVDIGTIAGIALLHEMRCYTRIEMSIEDLCQLSGRRRHEGSGYRNKSVVLTTQSETPSSHRRVLRRLCAIRIENRAPDGRLHLGLVCRTRERTRRKRAPGSVDSIA
jgi:hypothetical protein